jgi:hypothetical protein
MRAEAALFRIYFYTGRFGLHLFFFVLPRLCGFSACPASPNFKLTQFPSSLVAYAVLRM